MTDLIIVGGGAAGMAAGIMAARAGLSVTILEKNKQFGKKIGVTGNGKCNLTNAKQAPEFYRSREPELAWKVIEGFPFTETLSFFEGLGLVPLDRKGYFYPASEAAADVRKVLFDELCALGVKCKTNLSVTGIEKSPEGFLVHTDGYAYEARQVLVTTGGMAAPAQGTEGDGYAMAERFGHKVIKPLPALTALLVGDEQKKPQKNAAHASAYVTNAAAADVASVSKELLTSLAGVRAEGAIRIFTGDGEFLAEDAGELQFTTYGISGIPAMQVSRFAAEALADGKQVRAVLDLFPDGTEEEWRERLRERAERLSRKCMRDWFTGWVPEKISALLLKSAGIAGDAKPCDVTEDQWGKLLHFMKGMSVPVQGVRSFDAAQTTAGGVKLSECTEYLESRFAPGLYFAGEVLDVDGACGGYNLQWAWSSAARAVRGIVRKRQE